MTDRELELTNVVQEQAAKIAELEAEVEHWKQATGCCDPSAAEDFLTRSN